MVVIISTLPRVAAAGIALADFPNDVVCVVKARVDWNPICCNTDGSRQRQTNADRVTATQLLKFANTIKSRRLGCHNLMGNLTITTLTSISLGILLPPPGLNAGEKPYSLVTFNGILYTWYCS